MSDNVGDPEGAARRLTGVIVVLAGGAMHLTVGGFYVATSLVAPAGTAAALGVVWLGLAVLLWRWRRARPLWALLLPFVAAGVWWATVTAGERWLGWTA